MGVKFLKEHHFRAHQGHPGFFPLLTPWAWTPSTDVTQHPPLSFSHGDGGLWNIPSNNISIPIPVGFQQKQAGGGGRRWKSQPVPGRCLANSTEGGLGQGPVMPSMVTRTPANLKGHGHSTLWLFLDCQACNERESGGLFKVQIFTWFSSVCSSLL